MYILFKKMCWHLFIEAKTNDLLQVKSSTNTCLACVPNGLLYLLTNKSPIVDENVETVDWIGPCTCAQIFCHV